MPRAIPPPRVLLLLADCLLSACTATLGAQGVDDYNQGRYPEALSELRREEALAGPALLDDAHYTLYRGLTELAVGNVGEAHAWLSITRELVAAHPRRLSPADRGRLDSAWRTLGRMPGQMR